MRRLARLAREPFIATAIIALCAIGALRARSAKIEDDLLLFGHNGHINGASSSDGSVTLAFTTLSVGAARSWSAMHVSQSSVQEGDEHGDLAPAPDGLLAFADLYPNSEGAFSFAREDDVTLNAHVTWIVFPMWALALPPGGILVRRGIKVWHAGRRKKRRLCIACGYDLRGGGHERCPECGLELAH